LIIVVLWADTAQSAGASIQDEAPAFFFVKLLAAKKKRPTKPQKESV